MQKVDEIYQKYARTVYKYLLSKTHDENIAEELTQETFYQALRCIDRYDGSCKISTWLCAIAKNQLLSYWRKHPQHENIDDYVGKKLCFTGYVYRVLDLQDNQFVLARDMIISSISASSSILSLELVVFNTS